MTTSRKSRPEPNTRGAVSERVVPDPWGAQALAAYVRDHALPALESALALLQGSRDGYMMTMAQEDQVYVRLSDAVARAPLGGRRA